MRYAILLTLLLTGCAQIHEGRITSPPPGCEDYREMGGFCSLQNALDKVHASFRYQSDMRTYGRPELWAIPADGVGDCEDFALLMRQELNSRGIYGTRLVYAKVNGNGHLALELDGAVMDVGSPMVRNINNLDWEFISAGDETGTWRRIEVY